MRGNIAQHEPYLLSRGKDFSVNHVIYNETDDYQCELHFHDGIQEFILFERFAGNYHCNRGSSPVMSGDIIFTPSLETHYYDVEQGLKSWYVIQIANSLFEGLMKNSDQPVLFESDHLRISSDYKADLFNLLRMLSEQTNVGSQKLQYSFLQSVIGFVLQHSKRVGAFETESNSLKSAYGKLEPLIKRLKSGTSSLPSMQEAAKMCFVSDAYFSKIFKRTFGQTYSAFCLQHRIQAAARLLSQTEQSVTAVSYDLGYSSPSYFVTQFKRVMHITPRQFRTRLKKN